MPENPRTYVTAKGDAVTVGEHYRDNRASNIRTLRVDRIEIDRYGATVHCIVVRQDHGDGRTTEPMRETSMTPERLTGRSFVRVEGATNA
ncbi:hypothetical protein [Nocardia cyriacigeorgica]|uniref:hypothetical protein n=1 Tax=Nocardia cyriacigeorgica TaxID=135487 RepID=UPI0013D0D336|nr:hypothetical protein [Nocardia cyriacigeorgica]NEW27272.1 hypothetical protein [Nocardia cyriacigeorgica]